MSDNQNAVANIQTRLKELTNVYRLISNTINLINDVEIKGDRAVPVAEILGWLGGFSQSVSTQMQALQATLPKEESKPAELAEVKA